MEKWKSFKDNDGYEISSLGNVRSVDRYVKSKNGVQFKKGKLMKFAVDRDGYYRVQLAKDGKYKFYTVHRLVALTFLENPENLPCINHKNEIKNDNNVENLEWCTWKFNNVYKDRHLRNCDNKRKKRYQYDLNGNLIKIWNSSYEVTKGGFSQAKVVSCCTGNMKSHKGFIWKCE